MLFAGSLRNEGCQILIIVDNKDLLLKFAAFGDSVDLFDKDTLDGDDYMQLKTTVHAIIAIHASQNQGVDNHVQAAAIVRKTNCGEARASARVISNSYHILR